MADATTPAPVLSVTGLTTTFRTRGGAITAVDGVNLSIAPGETLALIGESGSGKSVTSLSIMRLLARKTGVIAGGAMLFHNRAGETVDLARLDDEAMRRVRGNEIAMVFQEPMTSLNPVLTIGDQISEPLRVHHGLARAEAMARALELVEKVGIPDAARRLTQYPHELSGGMRQRATIAMALACEPVLLIADEPTTALDVTIQAQILDLLRAMQAERGMGMLFVTHNLGVVAEIAHKVAIMYAGRIVESGPAAEVLRDPRHPYTIGLLRSMPRLGEASALRAAGAALPAIRGSVPSLARLPNGCAFAPRCDHAVDACLAAPPLEEPAGPGRTVRCLRWRDIGHGAAA